MPAASCERCVNECGDIKTATIYYEGADPKENQKWSEYVDCMRSQIAVQKKTWFCHDDQNYRSAFLPSEWQKQCSPEARKKQKVSKLSKGHEAFCRDNARLANCFNDYMCPGPMWNEIRWAGGSGNVECTCPYISHNPYWQAHEIKPEDKEIRQPWKEQELKIDNK